MQLKYALLHCSYSAPIWVSAIVATVSVVVAARDTVCCRAVVVDRADARGRSDVIPRDATGAAARDTVAGADVRDVAARDVTDAPRSDTVFVVAVRAVVVVPRLDTVFVVVARGVCAVDTALLPVRFVAFSSRTAASATPMQTAHTNAKDSIFFIS